MRTWTLAIREATANLARLSVRVTIVASVLLATLIVSLNVKDYESRRRDHEVELQMRTAATIDQSGQASVRALRALRPPSVASIFVRGIDLATPVYWDIAPSGLKESTNSTTSLLDGGETGPLFDLESLVRLLLGLLAIGLGVDTVANNRDNGMLGVLVSQPIGRLSLAAGKLLGGALTSSAAIGLVVIAGSATTWRELPDLGWTALRDPLAAFFVMSFSHLVTIHAIGMIIGALFVSPRAAMTAAVGFWICSALVAPPLVRLAATSVQAVTPRLDAEGQMAATYEVENTRNLETLGATYEPFVSSNAYRPGVPPPDSMRDRMEPQLRRLFADTRGRLEPVESRWIGDWIARLRWTEVFGALSPSTSYLLAAADIADTGISSNIRINTAVRDYQQRLNVGLFDDPSMLILRVPVPGTFRLVRYSRAVDPNRSLPKFEPPIRTTTDRMIESRWTLFGLAGYLVLSATVALAVFPRSVP